MYINKLDDPSISFEAITTNPLDAQGPVSSWWIEPFSKQFPEAAELIYPVFKIWIYGLDSFGWMEYYSCLRDSISWIDDDDKVTAKNYESMLEKGPAFEFDKKVNGSELLKTAEMLKQHAELIKKFVTDNPSNRITDAAFKWALCSLSILSKMIDEGYAELFPSGVQEWVYARFIYGYHWNINEDFFREMYAQEMENIYSSSPSESYYAEVIDLESPMLYTQYRVLNYQFSEFKRVEADLFNQLNFVYGRH